MKLLIIGDSHGNIANLKHVMGFAKHIKVGAVIHTGDWNNLKSLETVFNYNVPIYTVLGNADIDERLAYRLQRLGKKSFNKKFLKIEIDGVKIGVVHKFIIHNSSFINRDIVFCGHWHGQKEWEQDGVKMIRAGALENGISFAVFDTKTKVVELINECVYKSEIRSSKNETN